MLSNYFRTWFRNALRYRAYATINLLGLGIGIACCYLCVLYLLYDWSFDRFHKNHHRIYRVTGKVMHDKSIIGPAAGTWIETASLPVALSLMMVAEIPEIGRTTRVTGSLPTTTWDVGTHKNFLRPVKTVWFVDSSFEEMFSFPLIRGTFFSSPEQAVITRRFARTLSNDIDSLVGQVLWLRLSHNLSFVKDQKPIIAPVEIGGIVETPPRNSSLNFEILLPLSMSETFLDRKEGEWDWHFRSNHYILLAEEANIENVEKKLTGLIQKQSSFNSVWDLDTFTGRLQRIIDIYHYRSLYGVFQRRTTNPLYRYILVGISILILSVACLNYVLLYVGRFNSRAKELSIRQVFGANRRHLRYQLLVECFGYGILACVIGLMVAELASDPLESVLQTPFTSSTDPLQTAIILLTLACLIGLGTALYPATFMSSISAISILNKTSKAVRSGYFLKVLMAIQSGVTLVFVFCTIIIFEQTFFVIKADPGFEPANLVRLNTTGLTENEIDRLQASLSASPLVTSCVRTNLPLGWSNSILVKDSSDKLIDEVTYYQVDGPFLDTVGLQLLHGKPLYPNSIPGDVVVNEAFQKHLTSPQPLGQVITQADTKFKRRMFGRDASGRIVGVVKDFRFQSLHHTVLPTIITIALDDATIEREDLEILIRIREGSAKAFGTFLKGLWQDLKTEHHLTFSFVEDDRRHFYAREISWSKIVSGATLCTVLIASMGTLGMISLAVARRRKEIAIRRVMGAVPSKIASGVVLNYAVPGFIAAVIALPLSYFFMDEWLSIFAYRFQFGVGTILVTILLGILLPLIGGFVHALKVSSESPIVALRED